MDTSPHTSPAPGSIVVGVDASPDSDRAVVWAARQAMIEHRPLTLVHGIGVEGAAWLEARDTQGESVLDLLRAEGQKVLDAASTTARWTYPDVEIGTVMPLTDARLALLEIAERAAMLVVGTRGRGPLTELVMGSVSHAVTRLPPCPVVVVRPHDDDRARTVVLVGVDGSGASTAAIEFAYRQASARDLQLTVMYCFLDLLGNGIDSGVVAYDAPGLEAQRLVLDESVAGMGEKFSDVSVTLVIGRGPVDE
ncbi:MAG: UspA domain protein [Nocardioidaceae bacterium]|nr:UspA domain protein [Nocardioidaceae bacterium]